MSYCQSRNRYIAAPQYQRPSTTTPAAAVNARPTPSAVTVATAFNGSTELADGEGVDDRDKNGEDDNDAGSVDSTTDTVLVVDGITPAALVQTKQRPSSSSTSSLDENNDITAGGGKAKRDPGWNRFDETGKAKADQPSAASRDVRQQEMSSSDR